MKTRNHQLLSHAVVTVITARTRALMGTLRWQQGKLILSFAHLFVHSHSFPRIHVPSVGISLPLIIRLIQTLEILHLWFIAIHSHTSVHAPSSVMHFSSLRTRMHAEKPIQNASWIPAVRHWRNTPTAREDIWNRANHTPLCNIINSVSSLNKKSPSLHWERRNYPWHGNTYHLRSNE